MGKELQKSISLSEAIEWRVAIWEPAVDWALSLASVNLDENSKILELGYNSGKMSCYLAKKYNWNVTGYEASKEQMDLANSNSKSLGLDEKISFKWLPPEKTQTEIQDKFDAVFLKSFLYHNKSLNDYLGWIDWFHDRLKPGGKLIAIENGQGRSLDHFYRNKVMKNCSWKDNVFYNSEIENHIKKKFSTFEVKYFGGISQYMTNIPVLSKFSQNFERPHADNCFISSFVATV